MRTLYADEYKVHKLISRPWCRALELLSHPAKAHQKSKAEAPGGFQSRRIVAWDDGSIMDMLIWNTAANGEDAASRIVVETANSSVHAAIEQCFVVWHIVEVRHHIDP